MMLKQADFNHTHIHSPAQHERPYQFYLIHLIYLEAMKAHGKEYPDQVLVLMLLWRKSWEQKELHDTQLVTLSYRKKKKNRFSNGQ